MGNNFLLAFWWAAESFSISDLGAWMVVSSLDRINGFLLRALLIFLIIFLDYCLMCEIMHFEYACQGRCLWVCFGCSTRSIVVEVMTMAIQIVLLGTWLRFWSFLLWVLPSWCMKVRATLPWRCLVCCCSSTWRQSMIPPTFSRYLVTLPLRGFVLFISVVIYWMCFAPAWACYFPCISIGLFYPCVGMFSFPCILVLG